MNDFLRQFFWPLITSLALIAALINFALAWSRRKAPTVMLVRIIAGLASLALGVVIILGKNLGLAPTSPTRMADRLRRHRRLHFRRALAAVVRGPQRAAGRGA